MSKNASKAPAGVASQKLAHREMHLAQRCVANSPDYGPKAGERFDMGRYMTEGHRAALQCGGDHLLGFNSRVDPGAFEGAAGTTADRSTYCMADAENWEFMPKYSKCPRGSKFAKADNGRDPCRFATPAHRRGGVREDAKTDPITHFKHEGVVFKDPWRPNRRTGYKDIATVQTWTWQQEMDEGREHRPGRQKTDCRGKLYYLSAGEEDLLPAAQKDCIKCEMPPSKSACAFNEKTLLHWCQRNEPTPRLKAKKVDSEQMWGCMVPLIKEKAAVGDTATQCDLIPPWHSDSAVATPPCASRGTLSSAQSEPRIGVYRPSSNDDRTPLYSDSGPSITLPYTATENVLPMQSEPSESRGSMESRGSTAKAPAATSARVGRAAPSKAATPRGTSVPLRKGARTSRSTSVTPRGSSSHRQQGFPYNPERRLSATLRGEHVRLGNTPRTSLGETQADSTPRVMQRSASATSGSVKAVWK